MTAVTTETCGGCGFDAADYTHDDLLGTLRALAPIWRTMTDGIEATILAASPAARVSSAIGHVQDSWRALEVALVAVDATTADRAEPALDLDDTVDIGAAVAELEERAGRLNAMSTSMNDADWKVVARAVHDTTHRLREAGRGLHALGVGAPRQHGTLVQVSASKGGVPKAALRSATITRTGVAGDRQHDRLHHGRPLQAVCLWSQDVIDALRAEGHTVSAGAAGENLTVSGIDWATIRPGVRLSVGTAVLDVSAFATPCAKNAQWFRDREFRRMDHSLHPGWSRAYAWVVDGGTVAPGDVVVVEP